NNVSPSDWIELPRGIFDGRSAITLSVWLRDLTTERSEAPLLHFSTGTNEAFYLLPDDDQRSATGAHLVGVHSGTTFVNLSSATPRLRTRSGTKWSFPGAPAKSNFISTAIRSAVQRIRRSYRRNWEPPRRTTSGA